MPKIELFYGYVTSENGDVYHAFEALDPERDSAEDDAVVSDLAARWTQHRMPRISIGTRCTLNYPPLWSRQFRMVPRSKFADT